MKRPLREPSSGDRISNLPTDVIERILMFLPIKEAAKTSILSTKWRHSWGKMPRLVFDGDFASVRPCEYRSVLDKLMNDIHRALQRHDGPIAEFVLAIPGFTTTCVGNGIRALIDYLGRYRAVRKLALRFYDHNPFDRKVDSSLFDVIQLNCLELSGCKFEPPCGFVGFSRLTVLELNTAAVTPDFFEFFVPNCPLLQDLRVLDCLAPAKLRIRAPNLRTFLFTGYFESIRFEYTPLLSVVSIQLEDEVDDEVEKPDMVAMFTSLPTLQQLFVSFEFLELLAAGSVPDRLPTALHHLKVLDVRSCSFPHYDRSLVGSLLFCLIRCFPNLHTLTMQMEGGGGTVVVPRQEMLLEFAESDGQPEEEYSCFHCLEQVKILGSHGSQLELDLVKFVLANAPLLGRVVIKPSEDFGCEKGLEFLKEVSRYKRVSKDAEVVYV